MDKLKEGEKVLSKVDTDLSLAYVIASKPHYKKTASLILSKFVLTRLHGELVIPQTTNPQEVAESRAILSDKLKSYKLLEVGKRTGVASYFGVADYFDDLHFLNGAMRELHKSQNTQLEQSYDLIYMDPSLLPVRDDLYVELQKRDDLVNKRSEPSYAGIDPWAYDLRSDVSRKVWGSSEALPALKEKLVELRKPGLAKSGEIKELETGLRWMQGLADLVEVDYWGNLLKNNLCEGGVFMSYGERTPDDLDHNLKLFDMYRYNVKTPRFGPTTSNVLKTYKKVTEEKKTLSVAE